MEALCPSPTLVCSHSGCTTSCHHRSTQSWSDCLAKEGWNEIHRQADVWIANQWELRTAGWDGNYCGSWRFNSESRTAYGCLRLANYLRTPRGGEEVRSSLLVVIVLMLQLKMFCMWFVTVHVHKRSGVCYTLKLARVADFFALPLKPWLLENLKLDEADGGRLAWAQKMSITCWTLWRRRNLIGCFHKRVTSSDSTKCLPPQVFWWNVGCVWFILPSGWAQVEGRFVSGSVSL